MVNNLDIYLLEHIERLQQSEKNRNQREHQRQSTRKFSLRLPNLARLRALLFL